MFPRSPCQAVPSWATAVLPSQAVPSWATPQPGSATPGPSFARGDTLGIPHGTIPRLCLQAPQQLAGASLGFAGIPPRCRQTPASPSAVKRKCRLRACGTRLPPKPRGALGCDTARRRCHRPQTEVFPSPAPLIHEGPQDLQPSTPAAQPGPARAIPSWSPSCRAAGRDERRGQRTRLLGVWGLDCPEPAPGAGRVRFLGSASGSAPWFSPPSGNIRNVPLGFWFAWVGFFFFFLMK